ncbi:MAG TPA: transporter [Verrucomicrobiae bacterium]|jgi:hypothetical protein
MKKDRFSSRLAKIGGGLLAVVLAPGSAWACACGCGVFDVGTSQMFPTDKGGMVFLDYDYQDQNRNWNGSSPAPRANNNDKEIETHFATLGAQYMFNRSWGAQIEVPYDFRHFKTQTDAGNVVSRNWSQLGDIRIRGIYTGFLPDLSAGLTFGLKLPTGDYKFDPAVVDRDTQIGTGSTDILLGGFFRHNLDQNQWWDGFAQFELDLPVLTQNQYRPGVELDTAAGVDYERWSLGKVGISPVAQIIFSERTSDSGAASASPVASGYQRLMLSPGVEFHVHPVKIYADAEFPVFQHFTGNQVAASVLYKVSVSWMF